MCKIKFDETHLHGGVANSSSKKRRRNSQKLSASGQKDFPLEDQPPRDYAKLITHYRPILFVDFLSSGELLVVERPLVDVMANLPPAYFKHKYGAS